MDVLEKAHEMEACGEDIVHLEIGEPDFDTPAGEKSPCKPLSREIHYTHSLGKPVLREAIAGFYGRKYGVELFSEQIIVTSGLLPGCCLFFLC